jgi:hypothetical protein
MRSVDARWLVIAGYTLFVTGSLLASDLSDDFSGPHSSLRAWYARSGSPW